MTASRLFADDKERREHRIVVEAIAEAMRELCDEVDIPPAPKFMRLPNLQHLWTPVSGRARGEIDLFDALARIHPTPAVLGFPPKAARAFLDRAGEERDGLYTGLAGWIDLAGDGEAAVVLRSAFLRGREAALWAGAGIMADFDPAAEWEETELKMATMRDALERRQ